MVRRHPGKNSRIGIALLATVACTALWSWPSPVCGQTAPIIDQGEVTSKTTNSVTIDWTMPPGETAKLEVTLFYGTEDGGTQENDWQHRTDLVKKRQADREYQVVLQDLDPGTAYVYRIRVTGPAGATWSGTATFRTEAWSLPGYVLLLIVVALLVVPFYFGNYLGKRFRMPDHGWKIGLITCTLACGLAIIGFRWPPKLGIDLSGGTILVYEVDQEKKDPNKPVDMDNLVAAVSERVNPGGQKEMTIRPYGAEQIEIIIPRIDAEEAKRVEKLVSRAGTLEFRILANTRKHAALIKRAFAEGTDVLKDPRGDVEARWVPVQVGQGKDFERYLRLPESDPEYVAIRETVRRGERILELLVVKDSFDVDGRYLVDAARDYDQTGSPEVAFQFNAAGARLFGRLTSSNLPDEVQNFYCKLGIILDGRLCSAPRIKSTIHDRGVIEMGTPRGEEERRNQEKEVDDLVRVLNAGSLPTALNEEPISRLTTGPTLGQDTIVKGCWAIGTSAMLVLVFMVIYYRFAGIVASAALLTNLVLIVAIMIIIGAAFTLPGLAGLVLTVGMAVDANVLIYERMREELARGAALRMAIRNGFNRAMSAIVDSNVTTLITGVVLWVIGTDVIKGFAITLILGVLLSMYTAIFCARVVFEIAERRRWISELTMMQMLRATQIDFLGKQRVCIGGSIVLIVVGLVAVGLRGAGLLDIDFTGGVSVVAVFDSPQEIADVRRASGGLPDLVVSDIQLEDEPRGTWYRINTSQSGVDRGQLSEWAAQLVRQQLDKTFAAEGGAEQRSQAIEAFRLQVVKVLETEPDTRQRESAIQTLDQQIADLFAAASEGPQVKSALGTVRRQINRIIRTNTAIGYVEEYLQQQFPGGLASNSMGFDRVVAVSPAEEKAAKASPPGPTPPAATDQTRDDLPSDRVLAMADAAPPPPGRAAESEAESPAGKPAAEQPSSQAPPDATPSKGSQASPKTALEETTGGSAEKPATPGKGAEKPSAAPGEAAEPGAKSAADPFAGGTQTRLTFAREVSYDTVMGMFDAEFGSRDAVPQLELVPLVESPQPGAAPKPDQGFMKGESMPYKMWSVKIKLPPQEAQSRLASIEASVADTPFFPSSNTIGSTVAGSTRMQAIYALTASLLFIVAYLWIRFQKVSYGLAAVVAVVHDVLVVLGAIALSAYLAAYLGFLLVDSFKIGLTVVAAFLTIIGYSLNDTIVIFDRIREIRGKAPRLTDEMVNLSVNQTLARTLLTNLTVAIVVVVLYVFGGEEIHAFAFALVIGMIAGTYSTIFIASPFLLWMTRLQKTQKTSS